jgi:uncharacterized protein (TIGR00251 family)
VVTDLFDIDDKGDVFLRLHVQPGAGRSAVVGTHGDALKVRVAAPPRDGRANDACVALIAETLGAKAADVELVSGQSSRSKRVRVRGIEAEDIERLLEGALGNAGRSPGVQGPTH